MRNKKNAEMKKEHPENACMSEEKQSVKQQLTMLVAIEKIIELAVDSQLSNQFYVAAEEYLEYLADRMEITTEQALVFALAMERSSDRCIRISSFSDMLSCRNIRMVALMGEADMLVKRGFMIRHKNDDDIHYHVPLDVIEAVKENEVFVPESMEGVSEDKFISFLGKILDVDNNETFEYDDKLEELIARNPSLPFCQVVKRYEIGELMYARLLLCIFANRLLNHDDDMVGTHDWEDYFENSLVRRINRDLREGTHQLCELKLLEPCNSDGLGDGRYFHLSDMAKRELFPGQDLLSKQTEARTDLTSHTTFAAKRLFYNPKTESQINQLTSLLMPEQFVAIQSRLEESGMRKGFACLFYGAPGTGKTETVNQLARITGRDVMMINVAKIKSCWVGESEKNIKDVFDRYRKYVEKCELAPILLFNEADAVLGIRQEGAQRAVDKMENSIQNIILQEMEQLNGIMIATTNLTKNLDKAFERRFLYKVEFERPDVTSKQAIWQSMIPDLEESVACRLAERYDLSGGQIENVVRKRTVEMILSGVEPTAEQMEAFCRAELLMNKPPERRRIGF